jgi:hypothetical protein
MDTITQKLADDWPKQVSLREHFNFHSNGHSHHSDNHFLFSSSQTINLDNHSPLKTRRDENRFDQKSANDDPTSNGSI